MRPPRSGRAPRTRPAWQAARGRPHGPPSQEAGDDVAGEVHVHDLVPEVVVAEQRCQRPDVRDATLLEREPTRTVHPGVDRDHHQRAGEPRDHDRDPGQEVRTRGEAVPAVHVDRDEDRLDEEREGLERESEPEDVAESGHEAGPEKPELEAEDRSRHDADGEEGEHHLRPAPGDRPVDRVARSQPERLHEEHERRKGDPEADERDVHGERERLHLPGFEQVLLVDGRERSSGGENERAHAGGGALGRPLREAGVGHGPMIPRSDPVARLSCRRCGDVCRSVFARGSAALTLREATTRTTSSRVREDRQSCRL